MVNHDKDRLTEQTVIDRLKKILNLDIDKSMKGDLSTLKSSDYKDGYIKEEKLEEASDEELAINSNRGRQGSGSSIIAMARLRESVDNLNKTTSKYSIILIVLTVLMLIGVLIQICLAFK